MLNNWSLITIALHNRDPRHFDLDKCGWLFCWFYLTTFITTARELTSSWATPRVCLPRVDAVRNVLTTYQERADLYILKDVFFFFFLSITGIFSNHACQHYLKVGRSDCFSPAWACMHADFHFWQPISKDRFGIDEDARAVTPGRRRHDIATIVALLALCEGNPPLSGQRWTPITMDQ